MTFRYGEFTEMKIHYVRKNCYVLYHRGRCLERCPFWLVFQKVLRSYLGRETEYMNICNYMQQTWRTEDLHWGCQLFTKLNWNLIIYYRKKEKLG